MNFINEFCNTVAPMVTTNMIMVIGFATVCGLLCLVGKETE